MLFMHPSHPFLFLGEKKKGGEECTLNFPPLSLSLYDIHRFYTYICFCVCTNGLARSMVSCMSRKRMKNILGLGVGASG